MVAQHPYPPTIELHQSRGQQGAHDVPQALALAASHGLQVPPFETAYFLSRETVVPTPGSGMAHRREKLFATMSHNASG